MYVCINLCKYIIRTSNLFKSSGNSILINFHVRLAVLGQKMGIWHYFYHREYGMYVSMYISMYVHRIVFKSSQIVWDYPTKHKLKYCNRNKKWNKTHKLAWFSQKIFRVCCRKSGIIFLRICYIFSFHNFWLKL